MSMKNVSAMSKRRPVVLSYGGGLNSWAMLLEAVRRGIKDILGKPG